MMGTIFQNTRVVVQLSPITAFTRVFTSDHVDSRKENELLLTTRGEANLSNDTEGQFPALKRTRGVTTRRFLRTTKRVSFATMQ